MSLYGAGDGCHADTIGCCHHLQCCVPLLRGGGGEEEVASEGEVENVIKKKSLNGVSSPLLENRGDWPSNERRRKILRRKGKREGEE